MGREVEGWGEANKKVFEDWLKIHLFSMHLVVNVFIYYLVCLKSHIIQVAHQYKNRKSQGKKEGEIKTRERSVFK